MQVISPTDGGVTASSRRLRDWAPTLSIRTKLPLLASILLLAVTFAYGSFAYRAVRRAALTAATDRLVTVADQLSASLQVSGQQLATGLRTIAADPPVRAALQSSDARARAAAVGALGVPVAPDRWIRVVGQRGAARPQRGRNRATHHCGARAGPP